MNDSSPTSDAAPAMDLSVDSKPVEPKPPGDLPPSLAALEQRVNRLEETVASLKDTTALEERILEKVNGRLQKSIDDLSEKFTAKSPSLASAARILMEELPATGRAPRGRYSWLIVDMFASARLMFLMFFDRRYAMAWTTHLVVWLFLPAILLSGWWFPPAWIPVFGHYLDKVLDLLLAFCVYKALSREMRRYREILQQRAG